MKLKNTLGFRILPVASIVILSNLSLFAANDSDFVEVIATQTTEIDGFAVLSENTTWASADTIILRDTLVVPDGLVLTIEPGTTVYGTVTDEFVAAVDENGMPILDEDGNPVDAGTGDSVGAVVVSRGGQIMAEGTPEAPIIFTAIEELEVACDQDLNGNDEIGPLPTVDSSGLWGGILILGNADITLNDGTGTDLNNGQIEGFAPTGISEDGDSFADVLEYGWDDAFPQDDADNSGILSYVRIQHGGFAFGEGNEINGLTLGGVGTGTTVEFVEIVSNSDDGIEFFGGTVNTNNIAVAFCQDDSFDLDNGVTGVHQFWFAVQNQNGDRLGEWDGLGGTLGNEGQFAINSSAPQIFNATFVGPGIDVGDEDSALFIDDAFSGTLSNSLITQKENLLVDFDAEGLFGSFAFTNNTVGEFGEFDGLPVTVLSDNAPADFYVSFGFVTDGNSDPATPLALTLIERDTNGDLLSIDPRPVGGSSATMDARAAVPAELVEVAYRGAFSPTENWLEGWSFLAQNGFIPDSAEVTDIPISAIELDGANLNITFEGASGVDYNVLSATATELENGEFPTLVETVTVDDTTGIGTTIVPVDIDAKFIRIEEASE